MPFEIAEMPESACASHLMAHMRLIPRSTLHKHTITCVHVIPEIGTHLEEGIVLVIVMTPQLRGLTESRVAIRLGAYEGLRLVVNQQMLIEQSHHIRLQSRDSHHNSRQSRPNRYLIGTSRTCEALLPAMAFRVFPQAESIRECRRTFRTLQLPGGIMHTFIVNTQIGTATAGRGTQRTREHHLQCRMHSSGEGG
jgi:hypothetical protein